ncbi:trifunctional serine/threonine-protein kinase/ATP-binding protein/sensor histidine kinase [Aetokthonos hydrillicola Thurmond2011]|jgi:predicted ATPase/signal transduction histidine kinase|uniref:histidine kinase n=3 Tax=Aetokthonos TaxID=1550243 RepID=A0AAP5M967_9CYAN|nr:ATP-binding sensor histidine kinase [Aetokthonos hydrillicola]MBO3460734.1 AAA family ATPase [Aetokthonos hydrillicola CCALA 1050]MBW4586407.1 AAA family ATPase [Aetokthonos hydrillicola CCALA 1050]MDR9899886.1 trifunctional serine/threonine-protein kinase/ATP-binding protein/sensor histidine kinase [Aetokthonos hydrillicola Thurmond2011]
MRLANNTHTNPLPVLSGYEIVEQLYAGNRTIVYRAVEELSQRPVVIKLLQQDYPSFYDLLRFRNQYTIAKNLNLPGVIRPDCLLPYGNGYALVMEDFGGIALSEYIQAHTLKLLDSLAIALQLSEILHDLYQNRVIHKDIKPANILIHPESKQVKLTDFSIASLLPKENGEIKHPNVLEGTLAYIAPEQTGRMNRGIDYRTDFYSLGVTLFELFTGELPFASDDPLELVHNHIAKPAPTVDELNPEIPQAIAQIVAKLMCKNAEERYQSALGLKYDLAVCVEQLQKTGKIESFVIGQRDICDRFTIPEKLYGREAEVQTLLNAFIRVSNGTSELLLVAGFSGIGKTAVVNEVHKPIVRQRGYFIKGKFDQYNRNIPFSAFLQVFRDLIGQLLSESDVDLQGWKASILEALGDNAQVIIDVIPELERIIGKQPPAAELSGTAAQNRFNLLFQKFTQVFTTKEHPLVMFLDDLQWADSASLKLMQLLMSEKEQGYLLLIGAYRDNEVFPAHPFMLTLNEVSKAGTTVNTITLAPLSKTSLNQLVADMLKCSEVLAQPLAELVYQKTQGNPFFATQFLKTLHQDQFITFNTQVGHWQCDITQVREAALTDDVVEFMAKQLQKLPNEIQNILKLAACIGNQFDLNTLAIVSEQSSQQVANDLWKGLQEGLILPISETYKFFQGHDLNDSDRADAITVGYKFLHDRVQQAAYSLIPDEQKQVFHLTIGRHLLNHTSAEQLEEQIFDIVTQLNIGCVLITDTVEQARLIELNLKAGRKAIATTAYDTATYCLQYAWNLLPADSWQTQYDLALACYSSAAEAAYLSTDLARMEALGEIVLQQARNLLDTAKVYEIKIDAYTSQGEFTKAVTTGLNFLQSFGIEFPSQPNKQDFADFLQQTQHQLAGRSTDELLTLPVMSSPQFQALLRMLAQISGATYLASPALYPLICCKQVQLSVTHGNIPASSFGYVVYGLLLCGVVGDIKTGYEFGQLALQLVDKFNNQEYAAKVLYMTSKFTVHWLKNAATTLQPLQEAYTLGLKLGDLAFAGYSGYTDLPVKLIQYVKNTQQVVMIDNLKTNLPVIDEYLTRKQPKSLLCLPIINHGQLIGIVSLKNSSTSGVFTGDRILILNFLCTQAAISLENAQLYQKARTYAQQLEKSQLQIVQSEKMASLGNLVAGVAHEINNPIGFLHGSISNAQEYVQDLLDYIALYQQYHPDAAAPVQKKAQDIDLEYLRDDLPELVNSMQRASDRITSISNSLRTFSRADTEYKVSADLHEGIDSTLLILKYRLKANDYRPAIQVITEYGDLPAIKCFPGQLNQVFMNILANAIDMFDEMARTLSYQEIEAHPQQIKIRTAMVKNQVLISIRDNGKGMSEDVKARIFDHLFTTKGVGKGTGLGLAIGASPQRFAIARQIVIEKHGGSLEVQSQLSQGTEFCIQLSTEESGEI